MDLSTMWRKLDGHEYSNTQVFFADLKLMIHNFFHSSQRLFNDKWKNLPQPKPTYNDDMDAEYNDHEDNNQQHTFSHASFIFHFLQRSLGITEMEKQVEVMWGTISALKQSKKKPPKKAAHQQPAPTASSSSKPAKVASSLKKSTTTKSGKKSAAVPGDDDVLTFKQKKDLSKAIQTLDGQKLERVIQIIHEGVPEIWDVCSFPCSRDSLSVTDAIHRAPRSN